MQITRTPPKIPTIAKLDDLLPFISTSSTSALHVGPPRLAAASAATAPSSVGVLPSVTEVVMDVEDMAAFISNV